MGSAGVAQATATAAPATTSAECLSSGPEARALPGHNGEDRSSMTLAQSKAWDAALQQKIREKDLLNKARFQLGTIRVDVRVHVITRDDGTGGVTRQQVDGQIAVLNQAYAGRSSSGSAYTPFRFQIKSYDVTANTDWYDWRNPDIDSHDEITAKTALHQGGYDDLNMYITGLQDGLLGYAYYPTDRVGALDGLVLLNGSLPGGSVVPYNEGDTATHEVGHWLNLAHTFENGCQAPGDSVADTPYQDDGDNIFECNESLNTCAQPGRDPVHNFMSYGDDPCLDRFTAGQSLRMVVSWLAYRQPY